MNVIRITAAIKATISSATPRPNREDRNSVKVSNPKGEVKSTGQARPTVPAWVTPRGQTFPDCRGLADPREKLVTFHWPVRSMGVTLCGESRLGKQKTRHYCGRQAACADERSLVFRYARSRP